MRELQNYVERAIVLSQGDRILAEYLPPHVRGLTPVRMARSGAKSMESLCRDLVANGVTSNPDSSSLYEQVVSMVEKELIDQVLKSCQGVQTKASARLGINRNTLHKKISDYQLEAKPE